MDADRYFSEMHRAMAMMMSDSALLLTVKVQSCIGTDAYLELKRSPEGRTCRIFYSTMGRRAMDFQLFRKGWRICHNEAGEMTRDFPACAENLIDTADFHAFIRSDILNGDKAARILYELQRYSGTHYRGALPRDPREGAIITVESMVERGAFWRYWSADCAGCLPVAAILYWLSDVLAGNERRLLQSDPQAAHLAAQWSSALSSSMPTELPRRSRCSSPGMPPRTASKASPHTPHTGQNERWKNILAVLSTV